MKKAHKKALLWTLFAHPILAARAICIGFKLAYAELKENGYERFGENAEEHRAAAEEALDLIAKIKGF